MTRDEINAFCAALPATTHVVQWGGADVWKVGDKVFAIAGWSDVARDAPFATVTFKVSELSFEVLKDQPGLRPAPYLASRGFTWIQHHDTPGLADDELKTYLAGSHALVAEGLTKKKRRALGLA